MAQERRPRLVVVGRQGDPHAEGDERLTAGLGQRIAHGRPQTLGDLENVRLVGHLVAQHRELVAPEPGQGVTGPQGTAHPVGHRSQQAIAHLVTEIVVHHLEAIEIEEHHRHPVAAAPGPAQGHLEAIGEEVPVGEVGERVVDGGVGQVLAHLPALGDVLDLADEIEGLSRRAPHARRADRGPHRLAVGVEVALLDGEAVDGTGGQRPHLREVLRQVVGVGQVADVGSHQDGGLETDDLAVGRVDLQQDAVGIGQNHPDRGHVEGGPEAFLGGGHRRIGPTLLGDVLDLGHDVQGSPVGLPDARRVDAHPHHPAVVPDEARLGPEMDGPPGHQGVDLTRHGLTIGGVDDVGEGRSHQLVARATDDPGGGGVDPQEQAGRAHQGHPQGCLVEGEIPEGFPAHRPRTNIETPPLGPPPSCVLVGRRLRVVSAGGVASLIATRRGGGGPHAGGGPPHGTGTSRAQA